MNPCSLESAYPLIQAFNSFSWPAAGSPLLLRVAVGGKIEAKTTAISCARAMSALTPDFAALFEREPQGNVVRAGLMTTAMGRSSTTSLLNRSSISAWPARYPAVRVRQAGKNSPASSQLSVTVSPRKTTSTFPRSRSFSCAYLPHFSRGGQGGTRRSLNVCTPPLLWRRALA